MAVAPLLCERLTVLVRAVIDARVACVVPDAVPVPTQVLPNIHVLPRPARIAGDDRVGTFETIGTDDCADVVQPEAGGVVIVVVASPSWCRAAVGCPQEALAAASPSHLRP